MFCSSLGIVSKLQNARKTLEVMFIVYSDSFELILVITGWGCWCVNYEHDLKWYFSFCILLTISSELQNTVQY